MSVIDKQRIAAVEVLTNQGYRFEDGAWTRSRMVGPDFDPYGMMADADAMHALLMLRADALAGCTENSEESAKLERLAD
jgi:hypothetical protein